MTSLEEKIVAANRFGIPAQVHEECLTGFAAWRATVYPAPLCGGAAFDPALVEETAGRIGRSVRSAGVHQGLAPVLDVTRDYRWGRTEETIGEDPSLVGTIGAAYVRGLERAGVVATLKHFAGYSASRGRRVVEPGDVQLRLGRSSGEIVASLAARLVGDERETGHRRELVSRVCVAPSPEHRR
ncbi:glycoside hydrolase family 3 N-terminal domain-containing protein [Micromonospora endophytica]|uniref:glycoside hydrolase family 3 N-terminal domain-containing protein n=1 Tax=Micromonospora endophytica TaxID=515350 RepID=UPI003B8A95F2